MQLDRILDIGTSLGVFLSGSCRSNNTNSGMHSNAVGCGYLAVLSYWDISFWFAWKQATKPTDNLKKTTETVRRWVFKKTVWACRQDLLVSG